MDIFRQNTWPRLLKKPRGKRVVVLAPHMDDEIIGCGGTLCKHVDAGDRVAVIYFTSGEKGNRDFCADTALSEQRRAETRLANAALGIQDVYFLDLPDGSEASWDEAAPRLAQLLQQLRPQLLYLPPFYDLHTDHRKTNTLLRLAAPELLADVCVYEVWSPVQPNVLVNITEHMPRKLQAIRACTSQLDAVPYDKLLLGLNAYRAAMTMVPQVEYAEAFCQMPLTEYFKMWEK